MRDSEKAKLLIDGSYIDSIAAKMRERIVHDWENAPDHAAREQQYVFMKSVGLFLQAVVTIATEDN